ncbi:MAG TPA: Gfo/Idh/MocA family oxidoreductase [Tepidisphaeraceae bacterium]|jgi:predicted dehydrogenase|nr:Gfo/Idh/MocA family oxidoreductase [Tepidisphaeraceae bacterium]
MINLALVGCGGMAQYHAMNLKPIEGVKVVALADCNPTATAQLKQKFFPDAVEFESFENLIENPPAKLDGVVLVTPHTLHFPQATAALKRGLHVLVEKPMVTSSQHAYELAKTVRETGKLLGIAYQSPYTAEFQYLARERDAGRLGRVQIISGWLSQDWLKLTKGLWRQDISLSGGGMMYDSGAHLLNAFMWLMNDPVVEVACFYDKANSPVDINGAAIVRFQNGALGSICIGGNSPPFRTEIQIQTDKMLIVTDQYGGKLEMTGREGRRIYPHVEHSDHPSAGTAHLNFVRAIRGEEPLRAPVRYGVLLSALMDALYESEHTDKVVNVKPVPAAL